MAENKEFNIDYVINKMDRDVFCSEADFRFTLAREIEKTYCLNNCGRVFCEFPPNYESEVESKKTRIHIDILVIYGEQVIPIELKYRTMNESITENAGIPITFELCNQSAYDDGCYGYIRDICRIGEFLEKNGDESNEGYAVFLTNDKYYCMDHENNSFKEFGINEVKKGKKEGKVNGVEKSLSITGDFELENIKWKNYKGKKTLKYKVVKITKNTL